MPQLTFRSATPADIPTLRSLAERVWRVSYADLLSPAQIIYMLGWMYGPETIASEMARGVNWILAQRDGQPVGYFSMSPAVDGAAELHKLYLLPTLQGGGLGQAMLRQAQDVAAAAGASELRLNVNKGNLQALRSYARAGFRIVDAVVADIGDGFVMDDYVLKRPLGRTPLIKICGLSTPDTLEAAIAAGADQIGLVFFAKSPRNVTLAQARGLADQARRRADIVVLTVDATDAEIDTVMEEVRPDWLQLHGREPEARVTELRARTGRPVMKAVGIAGPADLASAAPYRAAADRLLFDAKPPPGAALPGGNGVAFEWTVLQNAEHPFMLSGGLSPDNVADAIRAVTPAAVDVSSGVETAPGRKDPDRIAAFVAAARRA